MSYPACTLAASAAYGLNYLLAIMVEGAEEDPPRKAVEAVALLAAILFVVGGGVSRALR